MDNILIQLALIAIISMLPLGEGRIGILLGVLEQFEFLGFTFSGFSLPPFFVFSFALLFNTIGLIFAYFFFKHIMKYLLYIKFLDKIHYKYTHMKYKKVKPFIDKYGPLGLIVFVAIPLPGSGVWTAALVAVFLEMRFDRYFYVSFVGIVIALLITLYTALGANYFLGA